MIMRGSEGVDQRSENVDQRNGTGMGAVDVSAMGIDTPGATAASRVVAAAVLHEGPSGYWRLLTRLLVGIGRWQNGWDCKLSCVAFIWMELAHSKKTSG